MSPDRLHDTCLRAIGRPPLRLIHERTAYEAQILLQRSTRTVDQIAGHLGFRSSGQFNKFFKMQTGIPPGEYRRSLRRNSGADRNQSFGSYADWP